jgi:hypothetical protein
MNEQKERVKASQIVKYTMNAQYTIYVNRPKKTLKRILPQVKGGLSESSPLRSGQSEGRLDLMRGSQRHSELS